MLVLRTSKRRLRRARTLGRCRGRHPLVVEYRGIGFRIGTCGREALTDLVERIGGSNTLFIGGDLAGVGFVNLVSDIAPLLPCCSISSATTLRWRSARSISWRAE